LLVELLLVVLSLATPERVLAVGGVAGGAHLTDAERQTLQSGRGATEDAVMLAWGGGKSGVLKLRLARGRVRNDRGELKATEQTN